MYKFGTCHGVAALVWQIVNGSEHNKLATALFSIRFQFSVSVLPMYIKVGKLYKHREICLFSLFDKSEGTVAWQPPGFMEGEALIPTLALKLIRAHVCRCLLVERRVLGRDRHALETEMKACFHSDKRDEL